MALPEKDWQAMVVELATLYGWAHFHPYNMRRSDPGWPDLVLARAPELVIVELKADSGRLNKAQSAWLARLSACGVETHVWRPRHFTAVQERLKRRR